jgi:hypothetical protein
VRGAFSGILKGICTELAEIHSYRQNGIPVPANRLEDNGDAEPR